ncbi:hypothetical protein BI330_16600 [Mycobacterium sp. CBMA 623]|nr:hypothetical protein [Mycobacteroides sp. CBMA 326]
MDTGNSFKRNQIPKPVIALDTWLAQFGMALAVAEGTRCDRCRRADIGVFVESAAEPGAFDLNPVLGLVGAYDVPGWELSSSVI